MEIAYLCTEVEEGDGCAQVEAAAYLECSYSAASQRVASRKMSEPASCGHKWREERQARLKTQTGREVHSREIPARTGFNQRPCRRAYHRQFQVNAGQMQIHHSMRNHTFIGDAGWRVDSR